MAEINTRVIIDGNPYTLNYVGGWDASSNSPTILSSVGTTGALYRVTVSGSTAIDGESSWVIGDDIYFDGSTWSKIDNQVSGGGGGGEDFAATLALGNTSSSNDMVMSDTDSILFGNDSDFDLKFDPAFGIGGSLWLEGLEVSNAGGGMESGNIIATTGKVEVTGTATGFDSGLIQISSGITDSTHAIGTGGDSGNVSIFSGTCAATLGNSGKSGTASLSSGASVTAGTGNVFVQSGPASTTSGTLSLVTGTATSGSSGNLSIATGVCTAGTGIISLSSGDAITGQSGGTFLTTGVGSVASGAISMITGDASAGDSGSLILESGTATGTRGSLSLRVPIIDTTTESSFVFDVRVSSSEAFKIKNSSKTNSILSILTGSVSGSDVLVLGPNLGDLSTSAGSNQPGVIKVEPRTRLDYDMVNVRSRVTLSEEFALIPETVGVNSYQSNLFFGRGGTNAQAITFVDGWLRLITGIASNNETVVSSQYIDIPSDLSRWHEDGGQWATNRGSSMGMSMKLGQITDVRVEFGLRGLPDNFTDTNGTNKMFLRFDSSDGVTSNTNWVLVSSDSGTHTLTDTGVAASTSTLNIKLMLNDNDGVDVILNEEFVVSTVSTLNSTTVALGNPYFGVRTLTTAAKHILISQLSGGFELV